MTTSSWDEYFIQMAELASTRAKCLRRKVGAVIVRDNQVLSTGYNGPPRDTPHCDKTGCIRIEQNIPSGKCQEVCRGLHAEQNAIIQAAKCGININGAKIYCTHKPCITCMKMLINAGILEVRYLNDYPDELADQMAIDGRVFLLRVERK